MLFVPDYCILKMHKTQTLHEKEGNQTQTSHASLSHLKNKSHAVLSSLLFSIFTLKETSQQHF